MESGSLSTHQITLPSFNPFDILEWDQKWLSSEIFAPGKNFNSPKIITTLLCRILDKGDLKDSKTGGRKSP